VDAHTFKFGGNLRFFDASAYLALTCFVDSVIRLFVELNLESHSEMSPGEGRPKPAKDIPLKSTDQFRHAPGCNANQRINKPKADFPN
jgi:hypothetical protein